MTPPSRVLFLLISDHGGRFHIKAIVLPAHGVRINIFPYPPIGFLAPDHMIVEGGLPNFHIAFDFSDISRHRAFVLPDHNGQVCCRTTQYDDRMDVIGHDHAFIHPDTLRMQFDFRKPPLRQLTKSVQLARFAEDTRSLFRADRHKVVTGLCVVIMTHPRMSAIMKSVVVSFHSTSIRQLRILQVVGGVMTPLYSCVIYCSSASPPGPLLPGH